MRFLVDECTGSAVYEWLRKQNHEVFDRVPGQFVVVTETRVRFDRAETR